MPRGVPKAGYRKTNRYKVKGVQGLEKDIQDKAPRLVEELEKLTKPIICPQCDNEIRVIDKEVAMYLVDHAIGKSKSKTEVDITSHVQLNSDQIDNVMRNHLPQVVEIYTTELIGLLIERHRPEVLALLAQDKLLTGGAVEGEVKIEQKE